MADVKVLLKEARKLIDEQNYKEAQECCKNILKKDKNNYLALVLLGKSFQDSDQAPFAFQKAIANKPEHPLAWQGLANYYERKENAAVKSKLFDVYNEILNLQIDEDKTLEIISKLGLLGCSSKDSHSISILIRYIDKNHGDKLKEVVKNQIIELLNAQVPVKIEDITAVSSLLNESLIKQQDKSLELLYAKVILYKNDFVSAMGEVMNLSFFSTNVSLREWLCKYLCEKYVRDNSFCNFDIETHIDNITSGIQNSKYPALLRSMIHYENSQYLEAYRQCIPLINYHDADITEATFIINCTIKLKKWVVTQKLATNFLTKAKDNNFIVELKKFLFFSLAKQCKWKQAITAVKDIPLESLTILDQVVLAECYVEIGENPDYLIKTLENTVYYLQLRALELIKKEKYFEAIALLENCNTNATNMFLLGKAFWELKMYDKCYINLLKSAKENSENIGTFLYLGHIYRFCKQDLEKAKKCYEKAYSLNTSDTEVIKNLSETYTEMKLSDLDFELLKTVAKSVPTNECWIQFRLGLHYLKRRDWENTIISLRNVIKVNHNDSAAFECLADAYYSRGSFTSALRVYNKLILLNPSKASHCLTRIGYIHSLLTEYEQAISTFNKVLDLEPSSLLALKGISETWMRIGKKKLNAKLYGSARDCAQNAIEYITRALCKANNFSCFWKLLADTLIFITKLPDKYNYVHMRTSFKESCDSIVKKEKIDIYPQAIACYSHVAKKKQETASYDLASTYLAYYCETKKLVHCHISFNLAIACIKRKPYVYRNWNLLGKICLLVNKYNISQHCFIKALLVTRKWSVARIWCNLGFLYLKLNLHKVANYCFWRGQSTLPAYPNSWIGQALIAEVIREDEAMDLFRHASRLGYHPESALGYADWVCRTLKTNYVKGDPETKYVIEGLYATQHAIDLMEWFTTFQPDNACAYTILGILQERSGLLEGAFRSYEKALLYAKEDKKNIALLNMGRILCRKEKYDEAIRIYKAITEASLNSTCGLALALYKKGLYEESYAAYDTALHWLSDLDDEKADLLVAMASIVYTNKGQDDSKTLLFHSIQISQKKPTAYSLFAICSLGLIHSDQSLSKLALSELQKYQKDYEFGYDIGFLKSYIHVCEGNMEQAIKLLSNSLHDHPSDPLLWFCMAQYCLRMQATKAKIASSCAQRALCSARYCNGICNSAKILATASVSEHIAGDKFKGLQLAKEGLHMYPSQAEIWGALLFSLLTDKAWIDRKDWIVSAAVYMRRHLEISRSLSRWVSLVEKKLVNC